LLAQTGNGVFHGGVDSPRLRFAGRPSLPLYGKEGRKFFFQIPLSAVGEERDVKRSDDRVSQFCDRQKTCKNHEYFVYLYIRNNGPAYFEKRKWGCLVKETKRAKN